MKLLQLLGELDETQQQSFHELMNAVEARREQIDGGEN
jgi:hypothetical protein